MAKPRFEGSVSKRIKNSPLLLDHLYEALSSTSSKRKERKIYAALDAIASQARPDKFSDFYLKLLNEGFNAEEVKVSIRAEERGRQLEECLRDTVIIPRRNHPRYAAKHLQQRHNEYAAILGFYDQGEEDGTTRE